jgi:alpha-beta hydrolase superfamily lysophospholipase
MTTSTLTAPAHWTPPVGVRARGTLALVAGAGESPRVYERFGRRIAADGYLVGVFEASDAADAAAWLADQDSAPRVLAGSDRGAAAVLALAVARSSVDGVIIAGTPVAGADDADARVESRTACPVHLGVLAGESGPGGDHGDPHGLPDAAALATIGVPVLAFHGGADEVAPFAEARAALSAIRGLELVETVGGLHDALNDQSHRSVAARVVLWLERLRTGAPHDPIVRDAQTAQVAS